MKNILTHQPVWRERTNRHRLFARMIREKLGGNDKLDIFTDAEIKEIADEFYAMSRMWQKVTQENTDLRGNDYDDKVKLMDQKKAELGYEVWSETGVKTI